jgi:hypothetical protein
MGSSPVSLSCSGKRKRRGDKEGRQQVLRATFPGFRESVRILLEVRMDALARKFYETHDMKLKDEINRLAREYGKLEGPWVFKGDLK